MPEHSSMHVYLNWAKERIDEMDAALVSLEAKAGQMKAESKADADQLVADLTKRREAFAALVKEQTDAGEAAWARTKAELESQWSGFEAQVRTYFDSTGKQIELQQATFRQVAAAQVKAWHDAADKLQDATARFAAAKRSEIDAAVKQMKTDATEAEARLQKVKQAGSESWGALSGALAETRKAFDEANRAAWDAFKRAASP